MQEEAPALGKPVLVVRKETERPEAVEAGTVKLAGTERSKIFENPLYGSIELGAGLEFLSLKHLSFFSEIGFFGNMSELYQGNAPNYDNGFMMQQKIQIGLRAYL
jgi:hypothetical protein